MKLLSAIVVSILGIAIATTRDAAALTIELCISIGPGCSGAENPACTTNADCVLPELPVCDEANGRCVGPSSSSSSGAASSSSSSSSGAASSSSSSSGAGASSSSGAATSSSSSSGASVAPSAVDVELAPADLADLEARGALDSEGVDPGVAEGGACAFSFSSGERTRATASGLLLGLIVLGARRRAQPRRA